MRLWNNYNSYILLQNAWNAKWCHLFGKQFSHLLEGWIFTHYIPRNSTARSLPQWDKNVCYHQKVYMNVYSSFIWNHQTLETQMSFSWWTDKQSLVQSYNEMHLAINGDQLLRHAATWMTLKCIMLSERSQTQKVTYHRIPICMKI